MAADEAWQRGDVDGMVAHLSAAIRGYTAADEPCRAAMACVRLGEALATAMGNLTASRAWFARARRLVEDQPPCLEQGWVAVAAMGCDVDDPAELLAAAELALDRARRFHDVNLETKALADAGLAHVQAGRVAEGMALLDEAMALACGPADDAGAGCQVGVQLLHGLLLRRRLRARRIMGRPASAARAHLVGSRRTGVPVQPLRQRARHVARRARPMDGGRGRPRPGQAELRGGNAHAELAPRHRAGRSAHPPGTPRRRGGAAAGQGAGPAGTAPGRPPASRPW